MVNRVPFQILPVRNKIRSFKENTRLLSPLCGRLRDNNPFDDGGSIPSYGVSPSSQASVHTKRAAASSGAAGAGGGWSAGGLTYPSSVPQ